MVSQSFKDGKVYYYNDSTHSEAEVDEALDAYMPRHQQLCRIAGDARNIFRTPDPKSAEEVDLQTYQVISKHPLKFKVL